MEFTEIPNADLPLYSPDSTATSHPGQSAQGVDRLLFVPSEHNHSIPGAL
jgi:NAD(P)H-dependent FMN reductase